MRNRTRVATYCFFLTFLTMYTSFAQEDCSNITSTKNENNSTIFMTDLHDNARLAKRVSESDTTYYLFLNTTGNILIDDAKGYFLLLEGGKTLEDKEIEISVEANDDNLFGDGKYVYSAIVNLGSYGITNFFLYEIRAFKLYIFEGSTDREEARKLKEAAGCILMKQ